MEQCVRKQAMNKYLDRQGRIELATESFFENNSLSLTTIKDEIFFLMEAAKDCEGFDLTDVLKEELESMI